VPGVVSIKVYDVLGREVKSLVNASQGAETHSTDLAIPLEADSGVYFCRLELDDRCLQSAKVLAMR
jgi:hypothetical protein